MALEVMEVIEESFQPRTEKIFFQNLSNHGWKSLLYQLHRRNSGSKNDNLVYAGLQDL